MLAKVDGQPITDEDVADAMTDIGPGLPQKLEGAARQKYVLDYLIDLKLAAKKADADKLTSSPEFERKMAYYHEKLAMEQLLASAGAPRRPAEAPFEYVARNPILLGAGRSAAHRLSELFEAARFSLHTVDESTRRHALAALRTIQAELSA